MQPYMYMYCINSEVCLPRHLVCEPCGPLVAGGFDPYRQQIVLCENNIYSQVTLPLSYSVCVCVCVCVWLSL